MYRTLGYQCFLLIMNKLWHSISCAVNLFQGAQEKVLQEVDAAVAASGGGDGLPPYAVIRGMEYLEMVVNETLRLHPIPQIQRVCTAGKVRFEINQG